MCSLKINLSFFSHGNENTSSYIRVQIDGGVSSELLASFTSALAVTGTQREAFWNHVAQLFLMPT